MNCIHQTKSESKIYISTVINPMLLLRSENFENICHLEDRTFLRDITTKLPNLYLTTDQSLLVYDIRNTKQSLHTLNLNFSPYSVVQRSEVVNVYGEHWCLTTTDKGEIG